MSADRGFVPPHHPSRTILKLRLEIIGLPLALALASNTAAQGTAPVTPAIPPSAAQAPAAPAPVSPSAPTPLTGIRNKISAGDLLSAESILEVWRAQHGEDGLYLVGLSWLARGALLTGDPEKAKRYVAEVRARCADSLARGVSLDKSHDVEIALGAALEVEVRRRPPSPRSGASR